MALRGSGGPVIETLDGRSVSFDDALAESDTDALVVLHRGELVYERYFGAAGPHKRHTMMSCNKSMVGTRAECLIIDGTLDDSRLVTYLIPELHDSAWSDATVRQVMDMVIGMEFTEDYLDQSFRNGGIDTSMTESARWLGEHKANCWLSTQPTS